MLIIVGSAWLSTLEIEPMRILNDLLDMTKCCQNPLKGLFIRY